MHFENIEAVLAAVPTDLGWSEWVTVSQEDVLHFADATRAREWIHTDPARATREGPYGAPVAHGFLTLSLATYFQTQLLELPSNLVGINYGVQSARFPAAVPVGSRIRASGRLLEAAPFDEGLRMTVALRYEREGATKPPCVVEVISLVLPTAGPA
jgi:acyl dehydratase